MARMGEIRAGLAEFSFRQLPRLGGRGGSVSFGFYLPYSVGNFAGGRQGWGNYEKKTEKMAPRAEIRAAYAKFCIRQLPSASAASGLRWFRGFVFDHAGGVGNFPERKMEDGKY